MWGPKEAHIKSWRAHEAHAWISKVEYYDDARMLISCASDGQLVISDLAKGEVKIDGFRHRGELWFRGGCELQGINLCASRRSFCVHLTALLRCFCRASSLSRKTEILSSVFDRGHFRLCVDQKDPAAGFMWP